MLLSGRHGAFSSQSEGPLPVRRPPLLVLEQSHLRVMCEPLFPRHEAQLSLIEYFWGLLHAGWSLRTWRGLQMRVGTSGRSIKATLEGDEE